VVFIKEIVPRQAITLVANAFYKENYETMPMKHSWRTSPDELTVEYLWKKKEWNSFKIVADRNPTPVVNASEEEFITEHYWGYTRLSDQRTSEYEVKHPKWEMYRTKDYTVNVDFRSVYGDEFNFLRHEIPRSVFLAEGSFIEVRDGRAV
jgi:uncharacterized protein